MSAHCFVCGNVIEADGQLWGYEHKDGWLCDECDYGVVGILATKDAALDEMREALERHVEWLENVDHDYSNGNSACGCDEGAVLGQRGESQLLASSHAVLAKYPGGER